MSTVRAPNHHGYDEEDNVMKDDGANIISQRRRQSNSFKTLSSGLVSNSIFTAKPIPLPTTFGSPNKSTVPPRVGSLYSTSKSPISAKQLSQQSLSVSSSQDQTKRPVLERKISATGSSSSRRSHSGRKVSGEDKITNENMIPQAELLSDDGLSSEDQSRSFTNTRLSSQPSSPHTSFKSGRQNTHSSFNINNTSSSSSVSTPFRPTRPLSTSSASTSATAALFKRNSEEPSSPRRTSSSFKAVRENDLVSNSPFKAKPASTLDSIKPSAMGLGRPNGPASSDRRFVAGASRPPPITPPRSGSSSTYGESPLASSPDSAQPRRSAGGASSPRNPVSITPIRNKYSDGDDTETEGVASAKRQQRAMGSNSKKVTWATTEEVLEFDIEEERRRSGASNQSGSTLSERSYDEEEADTTENSIVFEGGSIEVHDIDDSYDSDGESESARSSASTVEEMMHMVDDFISEDVFSPSLISDEDPVSHNSFGHIFESPARSPARLSSSAALSPLISSPRNRPTSITASSPRFTPAANPSSPKKVSSPFESSFSYDDAVAQILLDNNAPSQTLLSSPFKTIKSTSFASTSQYAIPHLPENSPFIGFNATTLPLTPRSSRSGINPRSSTPIAEESSPTRASPRSATAAILDYGSPSQQLSRHASIVEGGEDMSTFGSMRGSIRGPNKMSIGRERFDERTKRHEALLSGQSTAQTPRAIPARPPLNSNNSSIGLSTSSVASSIRVILANESALDRVIAAAGGVAPQSPTPSEQVVKKKLPPKRKSLSTGDLKDFAAPTSPTKSGFPFVEQSIIDAAHESNDAFAFELESSIKKIFQPKAYQEHATVYADDGQASAVSAGDVDPGRAWRKKRPSDAFGLTRGTGSQARRVGKVETGKVFVTIYKADFNGLPIPEQPTTVTCDLSSGPERVQAGVFKLGSSILIKRDFDLLYTPTLEFVVDLKVPISSTVNPHLHASFVAPSSPSKLARGLRMFSSPKKAKAGAPSRATSPLLSYLSPNGSLARIRVVFEKEAGQCKGKTSILSIPFSIAAPTAQSPAARIGGTFTIKMFYLPAIPGIDRNLMPGSIEECRIGLELAEMQAKEQYSGVLTQLGGDCSTWKRRMMKVNGSRLIPYSEVTKKAVVEIDLSLATHLTDLNAPLDIGVAYDDSEPWRMERSFRITFKDGNEINFFADDDAAKAQWLVVLRRLLGKEGKAMPPMWALALRKSVAEGNGTR